MNNQHNLSDEEVWMRAFCASMTDVGLTVQACVCAADDSLKAFRSRFPKEELNCEPGTILNAAPDSEVSPELSDKGNPLEPWERPNSYGEYPGDICCQRSTMGRCHEHDKDNYVKAFPKPPVVREWKLEDTDVVHFENGRQIARETYKTHEFAEALTLACNMAYALGKTDKEGK